MKCSRCAFAKTIEGSGGNLRFEETPCASCKLAEDSSHTMEFDEARDTPVTGGQRPEDRGRRSEIGGQMDDPELPLSVLAEAVRSFLDLPPRTFRILQRRYHGDAYAAIAEELELTPQAVEIQLKRALEAHPHLNNLLPEKARRKAARKRKRLSMARRGKTGSL